MSIITTWLDLPEWAIALTLVLGYGASGALAHWLTFRPGSRNFVTSFQGVVGPFFVSSGILFALMITFLASGVWEINRSAQQVVMQEREGAVTIIALASSLPAETTHLRTLARRYIRLVLDSEWGTHPSGQGSPDAEEAMLALLAATAEPTTAAAVGPIVQSALIAAAQRINVARADRLALSDVHSDETRWITVLVLGLLTQISIAAVHLDRARPQILALILSTLATVTALSLVAVTERPFAGAVRVSAAPLEQILSRPSPQIGTRPGQ